LYIYIKKAKIKKILGNLNLSEFTEKVNIVQTGSAYIKTLIINLKYLKGVKYRFKDPNASKNQNIASARLTTCQSWRF